MQMQPHKMTRVTSATEALIITGPCRLVGIYPEATTTGTISVRDAAAIGGGSTARHTCAIGLPQSGAGIGGNNGVLFANGLTIQLSAGTDAVNVVWNTLF